VHAPADLTGSRRQGPRSTHTITRRALFQAETKPEWNSAAPSPDADHAALWIQAIAGDARTVMTWQTFVDAGGGGGRTFRGALDEQRRLLGVLNRLGHGIFAVVNECDPGADESLSARHVVRPRAVFTDDDLAFRLPPPIPPTMQVQPKKGPHTFWRVSQSMTFEEWAEAQWIMAFAMRSDPAMVNVDRVLRVPGFDHAKDPAHPVPVVIVHLAPEVGGYVLSDFTAIRPVLPDAEKADYRTWYAYVTAARKFGGPQPDIETDEWRAIRDGAHAWLRALAWADSRRMRAWRAGGVAVPTVEPFDPQAGVDRWESCRDWWRLFTGCIGHGSSAKLPRFGSPAWDPLRPAGLAWLHRWTRHLRAVARGEPSQPPRAFDPAAVPSEEARAAGARDRRESKSDTFDPESTIVVTEDGRTGTAGTVGRTILDGGHLKVFCPFHANSESPAAALYRHRDGVSLTCFGSCGRTWTPKPDLGLDLHENIRTFGFDDVSARGRGRACSSTTPLADTTGTDPASEPGGLVAGPVSATLPDGSDVSARGRSNPCSFPAPLADMSGSPVWRLDRLPSPAEAPVVLADGPMGCGKTWVAAAQLAGSGKRVLVITPTVALAGAGASRFGAKLYSSVEGRIVLDDVWVVCAPSVRRVSIHDKKGKELVRPDAVVIEEIEQVMGILHSPAIMREAGKDIRGLSFYRLAFLCRACVRNGGQVVALDAHGSDRAVRDLRRLTGHAEVTVVGAPTGARTYWTGTTEHRFADKADILAEILRRADAPDFKGAVYLSGQVDLLALADLLRAKGRSVVAIHADATPEDRATLDDVNASWKDADWVLYNDAAGSGVSYDAPGRHVFVVGSVWAGLTWCSPLQGVGRVRSPASVSSWIDGREIGWDTRRGPVRAHMLRQAEETMEMVYGEDAEGRPAPAPLAADHFESLVDHVWISRLRGADVAAGYYAAREEKYGVVLEDAPAEAAQTRRQVMEVWQAARNAVKGMAADEAMDAAWLSDDDANEYGRRGDLTPEERAQLRRHTTLERFGRDDRELVADTVTGHGRRWNRIRALVAGMLVAQGLRTRLRDAERRRVEIEAKDGTRLVYKAQASHDEARAEEVLEVLRLAGIDTGVMAKAFDTGPEAPWEADPDRVSSPGGVFHTFEMPDVRKGVGDQLALLRPLADTYWSDATLRGRGFVEAVMDRAQKRDYGLLGLPTVPKDFDPHPSAWLGSVLASWGIGTKPARLPAGVVDKEGRVADTAGEREKAQLEAEAAWKRECRAQRKAEAKARADGRHCTRVLAGTLRPPARASARSIDVEALAKTLRLAERHNRRMRGLPVCAADECPVMRLDPDEPLLDAAELEAALGKARSPVPRTDEAVAQGEIGPRETARRPVDTTEAGADVIGNLLDGLPAPAPKQTAPATDRGVLPIPLFVRCLGLALRQELQVAA